MEHERQEVSSHLLNPQPAEYHIAQANFGIRDLMSTVLEPHGLKVLEWRILQSLDPETPLTICDLSERAIVERSFTGRTVDRLAERGLVRKKASANDRRFVQVTLSARGTALLRSAEEDIRIAREDLLQGIGHDKINTVIEVLRQLSVNAAAARRNISNNP